MLHKLVVILIQIKNMDKGDLDKSEDTLFASCEKVKFFKKRAKKIRRVIT
jgi:hypothetical protein